jgi:hypothetical protein
MQEIWKAYEAREEKSQTTFKSLSLDFQKSLAWRDLSRLTQDDYLGCHYADDKDYNFLATGSQGI